MKKRKAWPARQDSRITSQYIPDTGDIVIGVARGFTGAGEVLYKLTPEVLAGAIEDRKELAVIVNNLGLLVLAQLTGFNLAESLEDLPRAIAKWGHMEKEFNEVQAEAQKAEALRIAQETMARLDEKANISLEQLSEALNECGCEAGDDSYHNCDACGSAEHKDCGQQ